jgi:hypothetical protein
MQVSRAALAILIGRLNEGGLVCFVSQCATETPARRRRLQPSPLC